jgi:hypothetical protein
VSDIVISRDPGELIVNAHVWLAEQRADPDGIRNVMRGAAGLDAMRQAHKRAGDAAELVITCAEAARYAERRLGQLLLEGRTAGTVKGAGRSTIDASMVGLADLGIPPNLAADAVIFADLDDSEWESVIDGARDDARENSDAGPLARAPIRRSCDDVIAGRSDDEWYTPAWLFDALGLEFDIDVCAPVDRTFVSTPARRFLTEADDGLRQPWDGLVWCNPPYSAPRPWAERMTQHGDGILLCHVPINGLWCLDAWHHCDGLRLLQGMEFVRPSGQVQRPGYWLQLVGFGARAAKAIETMSVAESVRDRYRPSPAWRPL